MDLGCLQMTRFLHWRFVAECEAAGMKDGKEFLPKLEHPVSVFRNQGWNGRREDVVVNRELSINLSMLLTCGHEG